MSYLYSSDEVFYRFGDDEFWRNRFQAGCNRVFSRHAGLQLYYQRQDSRHQTPGAIDALGVLRWLRFDQVDEDITIARILPSRNNTETSAMLIRSAIVVSVMLIVVALGLRHGEGTGVRAG